MGYRQGSRFGRRRRGFPDPFRRSSVYIIHLLLFLLLASMVGRLLVEEYRIWQNLGANFDRPNRVTGQVKSE